MNKQPFKRAKHLFAIISTILKLPEEMQAGELAKLPHYESRGKGKSRPFLRVVAGRKPSPNKYDKKPDDSILASQQEWNTKVEQQKAHKQSQKGAKRLPDGTVMVGDVQAA